MRGFRAVEGRYVAELDGTEREVLATVVADVAELLGAGRFDTDVRSREGADAAEAPHPLLGLRMSPVDVPAPIDPAVHRLLPDASQEDPELAAEFRRLTEGDLRRLKVERLRMLWQALVGEARGSGDATTPHDVGGADLAVPRGEAAALAATITDLRLVLAERLGVESDEDSDALYEALDRHELGEEDPDRSGRELVEDEIRDYLGSVYAALSWLQESLVAAMMEDLS
ncbi:DUF2017 family protein [Pengzhenrongella sp.]|jgi:hypothetical protein|uniref:DUF2017 family protein n=1 Tax=Pengzhenrongella sp. TaxID=2888820 RepID=UPI002F938246